MGRDAVVWKCRSALPSDIDPALLSYDRMTGEYWVEGPGARDRYPRELFIAAHEHLGNTAGIAHLRALLEPVLGQFPLLRRVLWSGVHAGDQISAAEAGFLLEEVEEVRGFQMSDDPALEVFLGRLVELANAARENGNPIVFT